MDKWVVLTISAWVATMLPHTQNRRATYLRSFDAAIINCLSLALGRDSPTQRYRIGLICPT